MRKLTVVAAMLVACFAQAQMPENSFLVRPVRNVDELVHQARTNRVVMDRFARHYQMSPEAVVEMLSTLREQTLEEDMYFEVWNVPPETGELRSRRLLLKRGTRVLVNRAGQPVMKLDCGNPLLREDEADAARPAMAVTAPITTRDLDLPVGGHLLTTDIQLIEPAPPVMPDVEFVVPPPPEDVVIIEERAGAPFALAPLGLLPSLLIGLNTGGVIPEPGTIIAVGAGCAFLAARRRRRSR